MNNLGKIVKELSRADGAVLYIYENGVVMVGSTVDVEHGFNGFWGKRYASKGGKKSSANMTSEQRSERARKAAAARWRK